MEVDIKLGAVAIAVLVGEKATADGTPIPVSLYNTWTKELYLLTLGLLVRDEAT